jgi:hypothetical protein
MMKSIIAARILHQYREVLQGNGKLEIGNWKATLKARLLPWYNTVPRYVVDRM